MTWFVLKLEDLGLALARFAAESRRRAATFPPGMPPDTPRRERPPEQEQKADAPAYADERTIRRIAEAQHGGVSTAESAARFARGENPGGTHHKAVRREEGPEHPRPSLEEPQERKERVPGGERHIPVTRRGS
jgi:hypothetical protein